MSNSHMKDWNCGAGGLDLRSGKAPMAAKQRRRVLFAAPAADRSTTALLKAEYLAGLLKADLFVTRVLTAKRRPVFFRGSPEAAASANVARLWDLLADTCRWCTEALPRSLPEERMLMREGSFVAEVIQVAQDLRPELIVTPAAKALGSRGGARLIQLAHGSGVPVLAAQLPCMKNLVVAATDLSDLGYPVVKQADRIRRLMESALLLVHNVQPLALLPTTAESMIAPTILRGTWEVTQASVLLQSLSRGTASVETIVTQNLNTPAAILAAARQHKAELLVIGSRPRAWFESAAGSVAARVVSQSRRSTLIVPLPTRGSAPVRGDLQPVAS